MEKMNIFMKNAEKEVKEEKHLIRKLQFVSTEKLTLTPIINPQHSLHIGCNIYLRVYK
jgi:hypothetical protein